MRQLCAMKPPSFRPGVSTKNGKLYVFSKSRVCVLKGWPDMAAWTKTLKTRWRRFRPDICIQSAAVSCVRSRQLFRTEFFHELPGRDLIPFGEPVDYGEEAWGDEANNEAFDPFEVTEDHEAEALTPEQVEAIARYREERSRQDTLLTVRFLESIPHEVRTLVAEFPTRHWHLLSMIARCPATLDLVREQPAMAAAMASNWVFRKGTSKDAMRWIRKMLPRRRREILTALGFPEQELSTRIISKIPAEDSSIDMLLHVRRLLRHPDLQKILAHIKVLDAPVLGLILSKNRKLIHRRVLMQVAEDEKLPVDRKLIPAMLHHYVYMWNRTQTTGDIKVFQTVQSLITAYDALFEQYLNGKQRVQIEGFPEPPLLGTESIVPITNRETLVAEAMAQRNCVSTYLPRIAAGNFYVYSMLSPERATIGLRRVDTRWVLSEVTGYRNAPVSHECAEQLNRWLGVDIPF